MANRAGHGFSVSGRCCSQALATANVSPPVNHVQVPGSWLPNTDSGQVAFTAARTATATTALARRNSSSSFAWRSRSNRRSQRAINAA